LLVFIGFEVDEVEVCLDSKLVDFLGAAVDKQVPD